MLYVHKLDIVVKSLGSDTVSCMFVCQRCETVSEHTYTSTRILASTKRSDMNACFTLELVNVFASSQGNTPRLLTLNLGQGTGSMKNTVDNATDLSKRFVVGGILVVGVVVAAVGAFDFGGGATCCWVLGGREGACDHGQGCGAGCLNGSGARGGDQGSSGKRRLVSEKGGHGGLRKAVGVGRVRD